MFCLTPDNPAPLISAAAPRAGGWPFGALLPLRYRVIVADPPWHFDLYSERGNAKSPQAHYATMPTAEIEALPVGHLAAGDCVLALWATAPMLPVACRVLVAWGFRYVTFDAWAKQSRTGRHWAFGPGYVFRTAAEICLIGKMGSLSQNSHSERNLIVAPVRRHSQKPEELQAQLERMYEGPYAELFARRRRPGWSAWGDQLPEAE